MGTVRVKRFLGLWGFRVSGLLGFRAFRVQGFWVLGVLGVLGLRGFRVCWLLGF